MPARWNYRMFGLEISSGVRLPGITPLGGDHEGAVALDLAPAAEVERAFSGAVGDRFRLTLGEGETIDVVSGGRTDLRLIYGDRAQFHISAGGKRVLCAPADRDAFGWQRVLLDTVLGTTAIVQGYEALHAAAVELECGVVAIAAQSGGGKSTLCAELILRGARLFSDDMVFMARNGTDLVAHPGPPLMNLAVDWPGDRDQIGEVLAIEAGEAWIATRRASDTPGRLLALFLLDRRPDAPAVRVDEGISPAEMLGLALHSGWDAARRLARFDLLSELARTTPVLRVLANSSTTPAVLAGAVESAARGLSVA